MTSSRNGFNNTGLARMSWGLNEITHAKHLGCCRTNVGHPQRLAFESYYSKLGIALNIVVVVL